MTDPSGFAKLVPGFDFLQGLAKSAGTALPGMGGFGQWVAPTLDPAEIEKRIDELKTVQFWLEQNARMLAATIQALEVQRMTLSTLKTMNVQLGEVAAPFVGKATGATGAAASAGKVAAPAAAAEAAAKPGSVVDPMQWWGALTQQFTQLATSAMQDGAADAAKVMAGSVLHAPKTAAKTVAKAAAKNRPRVRTGARKKTAGGDGGR